jgi:hypothetical protein
MMLKKSLSSLQFAVTLVLAIILASLIVFGIGWLLIYANSLDCTLLGIILLLLSIGGNWKYPN